MAPDDGVNPTLPNEPEPERPLSPERLDSWKEIAAYLKRSVRTVRRWEAVEGLPVHRHVHQSSGSVYAFGPELDAWLLSRRVELTPGLESPREGTAAVPGPANGGLHRQVVPVGAIVLAALVTTVGVWRVKSATDATETAASPVKLPTGKPASKSVDAEAFQLLHLCIFAAGAQTYEGFKNGIALCQKAIDKQPDFAEAYAHMANYYVQLAFGGALAPMEVLTQAEAAARTALKLDRTLYQAHDVLAQVLFRARWDWSESEKEFRQALQLNPNYSEGHRTFSAFLSAMNRPQEAIRAAQRARDLDPLSPQPILNLGMAYRAAGDYDRAIGWLRQGLDQDPFRARAHFNLGVTYLDMRMSNDAIHQLETAAQISPHNTRFIGYLGYSYALADRRTEALETLERLLGMSNRQYVSPLAIARIYTALGNTTAGLGWLEKAYDVRDIELVAPATNPALDDLRSITQYREFFARIAANH